MGKKIIIKEADKPVSEMELDIDNGFMEDVLAPMMANAEDVAYIPLNRLKTLYLVVNGMGSAFVLPENFLYLENGGVQTDGLIPQVKTAWGTAFFVRVSWTTVEYKKKAVLESTTYDDYVLARNFMTDIYQRDLKANPNPTAFN